MDKKTQKEMERLVDKLSADLKKIGVMNHLVFTDTGSAILEVGNGNALFLSRIIDLINDRHPEAQSLCIARHASNLFKKYIEPAFKEQIAKSKKKGKTK